MIRNIAISVPPAVSLRKAIRVAGFYLLVLSVIVVFVLPFAWMLLCSLRTQAQNTSFPPTLLFVPTLENYQKVFTRVPFWDYALNSIIISGSATILGAAFGITAAYGVARGRLFRVGMLVLVARMVPLISYLVPWFVMFRSARLIGTYPPLVVSHLVITLPFVIWLMVGFFEDLPPDLIDQALVDGCSQWQAFYKVVLPIYKPGIMVASIIVFIHSWNNLLFALVLGGSELRTLPVTVFYFRRESAIDWGGVNASAMLVTLPVLLAVLVFQKYIQRGITLGSTKG